MFEGKLPSSSVMDRAWGGCLAMRWLHPTGQAQGSGVMQCYGHATICFLSLTCHTNPKRVASFWTPLAS